MTLIRESEPWAMTAEVAAQRRGYAGQSELALRHALEVFSRERWPQARLVHEIVMGEGRVRADVAAIDTGHIVAFEVKGASDEMTRIMHQVGMYQLCVPEVWMVVTDKHSSDAEHINYLLPSVGLLIAHGLSKSWEWGDGAAPAGVTVEVRAEAVPRLPVPELALRMLWAAELHRACNTLGVGCSAKSTRKHMVTGLLKLDWTELLPAICAQLRGRDALWRADPPVRP